MKTFSLVFLLSFGFVAWCAPGFGATPAVEKEVQESLTVYFSAFESMDVSLLKKSVSENYLKANQLEERFKKFAEVRSKKSSHGSKKAPTAKSGPDFKILNWRESDKPDQISVLCEVKTQPSSSVSQVKKWYKMIKSNGRYVVDEVHSDSL